MLTWYDKEAKYRERLWKERNLMIGAFHCI
jgi:hypothetical protein